MKRLLLLLPFIGYCHLLQAQCGAPASQIDLQANNIRARILNGGDLFTDFNNAGFTPNPGPTPSPSTIFAAGLWMGGLDPAGNLKLAGVYYRNSAGTDYSAGPLTEDGVTDATTCANWDRHFRVTADEIAAFLNALPMTAAQAIGQYPAIMGWPGKGNPYFHAVWGFDLPLNPYPIAPYVDFNDDGVYNPLHGDYPAVEIRGKPLFVPDEFVWSVFNDQKGGGAHSVTHGRALQIEVHQMAWAFHCPDNPVIDNTIFTSHKIINRAAERTDSFYVGYWVDFDLGCYQDDYVGCDPTRNTMFAYNIDQYDGYAGFYCNGIPTFKDNPPVQTVTFLGNGTGFFDFTLDKFVAISTDVPGTGDPSLALEYYRVLSGSWPDGTPLTYSSSGYGGTTPVDYCFPGNPANPTDWTMCSTGQPATDRRVVGSHYIGSLYPGAEEELIAAWTTHYNTPPPCNLGNSLLEVDTIIAYHKKGYTNVCSKLSQAPVLPAGSVELFPNPSSGDALLRYPGLEPTAVRIYDATGKLVRSIAQPGKNETSLKGQSLSPGMYTVQLQTAQGSLAKKWTIVR